MAKSIINTGDACIICGRPKECIHHVFYGKNRRNSEKYGMKVPLCNFHHNFSAQSVHFDHELDIAVKQMAQKVFEAKYSHEKFMEVFGKNYM